MKQRRKVLLILGNQLFPTRALKDHKDALVFMVEDPAACTYVRHHKHKLILILAAMRAYAAGLRASGFDVHYERIEDNPEQIPFIEKLRHVVEATGCVKLMHYEIEDKSMERRINRFVERQGLQHKVMQSKMFMTSREQFARWRGNQQSPRMAEFYKWQRRDTGILIDQDGKPEGGRWSFDQENRKPLPATLSPPQLAMADVDKDTLQVARTVEELFSNHPGSADNFALPVTRTGAQDWLQDFLEQRFTRFGDYEDALTTRSDQVFHSFLSPLMNIGLLTPGEVVSSAIDFASTEGIGMNSVEGFVRQVIGWREFMHGMYQTDGERLLASNFWNHHRRLRPDWYRGSTGILPLDMVIAKANRCGYGHHIERLMVAGNLMLLAEIHPREAYQWFMEMYVDSAEWVMVPNVFGMSLFADGGSFTTKPYVCGSNYINRMGDYPAGEWGTAMDGLFWRFIAKHREFFSNQPRLRMLTTNLDRMQPERRKRLGEAAGTFLREKTDMVREVA